MMSRSLMFLFVVFLQVSLYECGSLMKKDVVPEKVSSGLFLHGPRVRRYHCPDCNDCGFCRPAVGCKKTWSDGSCCVCRGCFASTATVSLENGERVAMSELQIGDRVETVSSEGKLMYSEVRTFMNKDQTQMAMYKTIRTSSNSTMSLTGNHLIYTRKGSIDKFHPIYADQLDIGDEVLVQENGEFTPEKVLNVSHSMLQGFFGPMTSEGNIVVDTVLASCYGSFNHDLAHISMRPIQWLPEMIDWIFGVYNGGQGYVNFLKGLGRWMLPTHLMG